MCYCSGQGVRPIKDDLVKWIATGGGIGYLPRAPGTWGSVLGAGIAFLLAAWSHTIYGVGLLVLFGVGTWAAGATEALLGRRDAAPIVIDEIVGILVTYYVLPRTLLALLSGFVLFRLFDILKPVPLPQLERCPGGWGIMLDDLAAGLLAQGCIRLLLLYV